MKPSIAIALTVMFALTAILDPSPSAYVMDSTVPQSGGCPAFDRWNLSLASPLNRRWSTSLPLVPPTLLTVAAQGTSAQLTEIGDAISDSFGAWSGVTGTAFNAVSYPGLLAPIGQVTAADSCTDDQENNVDGLNTICFNQSSMGFASGVLAFTRVITANATGVSVGASGAASFAGQILDADTLFRNDGQAIFATPAGLATTAGQGAYDLESLLAHEIGHWFGLDHSAVWRALMFPFAPPPGEFLGSRPTAQTPDGPLSDDDRTAIRVLYPDPNDTVDVGSIRGHVLPANPFVLAALPSPSPGVSVTGIFGAQVVAVDTDTGAVVAATLGGWTCNSSNSALQFDGSFDIERLPVGRDYLIYAEPLVGLALPGNFSDALDDLCSPTGASACTTPTADVNFDPRILPAVP
jgi:Matrixin